MKLNSIKILFAIIMMMAGITAQAANVITMTTSKKVSDKIALYITANGDYTVSGADKSSGNYYTLTSDTVTITGDATSLNCKGDSLTSLDVSGDTLLTYLNCKGNSLTSLDVSKCTKLTTLYCDHNSLTKLDVSNCTELTMLGCYHNKLTELDLGNPNKLKYLSCEGNNLGKGQMGGIVNLLADRTATTASVFIVFDPAGDSNTIFMTQVAAAKAKNWEVKSYDSNNSVYAGYEGLSTFTLTTKKAVGSVLNCKIALNGSSTALLMKGATYTAPDSDYTYSCTLDSNTVKIDGDIKLLECENGSLTSLIANQAIYANSISCINNYLRDAAMDSLVASLPDRKGMDAGTLVAIFIGSGENNVCTTTQVAAAKAKNWDVKSIDYDRNLSDYAGSSGTVTGTERIADDENATVVAIYNVNGMKLAQPQPGLNILKMSNGKVKKMFLKE
jgi:hypothetical protein